MVDIVAIVPFSGGSVERFAGRISSEILYDFVQNSV